MHSYFEVAGRLARDPFPLQGKDVTFVTVAVENNPRRHEADFVNIVVVGQAARFTRDYLKKGRMVLICGEVRTREVEDENGRKVTENSLVGTKVRPMDSPRQFNRHQNGTSADADDDTTKDDDREDSLSNGSWEDDFPF